MNSIASQSRLLSAAFGGLGLPVHAFNSSFFSTHPIQSLISHSPIGRSINHPANSAATRTEFDAMTFITQGSGIKNAEVSAEVSAPKADMTSGAVGVLGSVRPSAHT